MGVLHAVLVRGAPGVDRVDITHSIRPHDVRAGALALRRAAPWLAGGVVLAVVDPGVGTDRQAVAIEVQNQDGTTYLVGPDNGLLTPAAAALGRTTRAVALRVHQAHTFAGRDTFAPAAAALAVGRPMSELDGPAIDPATLVPAPPPRQPPPPPEGSYRGGGGGPGLVAEVLWVDHFGNAQLDLAPHDLPPTDAVDVTIGATTRRMEIATSYAAIAPDAYALVADSYGLLAICRDRAPAATELGLTEGQTVVVHPTHPGPDRAPRR